jgi:hypothetical protein
MSDKDLPTRCGECGSSPLKDGGFQFTLEYPPDTEADPGSVELSLCETCADGIAATVLIERALAHDLEHIYAGLPNPQPQPPAEGGSP